MNTQYGAFLSCNIFYITQYVPQKISENLCLIRGIEAQWKSSFLYAFTCFYKIMFLKVVQIPNFSGKDINFQNNLFTGTCHWSF
jgi:hypothetical protein